MAKLDFGKLTAKQKAELHAVYKDHPPGLNPDAYERVFEPYHEAVKIKEDIAALEPDNAVLTQDERSKIGELCERACQWHQSGIPELARRELREARYLIQRGVTRAIKQNSRVIAVQVVRNYKQKAKDKKKRDVMEVNREDRLTVIRDEHHRWKAAADAVRQRHPDWPLSGVARQVQKDLNLSRDIRTVERAIKKLDVLT